jgi:hypothetical protein
MRSLLVTAVVSLGTALGASATCLQHSFKASQSLVNAPTYLVGTADFDGDGKADLLAYDVVGGINTYTIYLDFKRPVAVPPAAGGFSIEDVNGDGRPDLVAADLYRKQIIVLLNRGDATFVEKDTPLAPTAGTPFAAWADFNGDGRKDLFIDGSVDPFLASMFVYISVGDGTFVREYSLPVESGYFLFAEDVNGDGRADLFFQRGLEVIVYLRQDKGFALAQSLGVVHGDAGGAPDLNGDGRADIIVSAYPWEGDYFTVMFDLAGPPRVTSTRINGSLRLTADFNGDGAPDLLVETHDGSKDGNGAFLVTGLQVWLNNRDGTFRLTDQLPGYHEIENVMDWDGDGLPDLFVREGSRFVLHNNGDGTFRVPRAAFPAANAALAGDFDGDGADDIALPNAIAWNNGDNTFHVTPIDDPRLQHAIRVVDANGDGRKEIVSIVPNAVVVFSPRRDGTIAELGRIAARPVDATVGDFTGKHRPEVALLPDQLLSAEVYDLQSGAVQFVVNIAGSPRAIAAADLNGDGMDDIVVTGGTFNPPAFPGTGPNGSHDGFVSVFLSTGSSFGPEQRTPYPRALDHLVSGDFNGDGKTDIAGEAVTSFGDVAVFYGDGHGAFPRADRLQIGVDHLASLEAVDLDEDGRADLLINGTEAVFYGAATGLRAGGSYFGPRGIQPTSFPTAPTYAAVAVRSGRAKLPWIIAPTQFSDAAFVYEPACAESRVHAVRP